MQESSSESATHLLVGPTADTSDINEGMSQARVVYVDWLEACLATQHRVPEADYLCRMQGQPHNLKLACRLDKLNLLFADRLMVSSDAGKESEHSLISPPEQVLVFCDFA